MAKLLTAFCLFFFVSASGAQDAVEAYRDAERQFSRLVAKLGDADFATRLKADKDIRNMKSQYIPVLLRLHVFFHSHDAETTCRLRAILEENSRKRYENFTRLVTTGQGRFRSIWQLSTSPDYAAPAGPWNINFNPMEYVRSTVVYFYLWRYAGTSWQAEAARRDFLAFVCLDSPPGDVRLGDIPSMMFDDLIWLGVPEECLITIFNDAVARTHTGWSRATGVDMFFQIVHAANNYFRGKQDK